MSASRRGRDVAAEKGAHAREERKLSEQRTLKGVSVAIAMALLANGAVAADNPPASPSPGPAPALTTWSDYLAALKSVGDRMDDKLPASLKQDPAMVQESYRLLLAGVARATL